MPSLHFLPSWPFERKHGKHTKTLSELSSGNVNLNKINNNNNKKHLKGIFVFHTHYNEMHSVGVSIGGKIKKKKQQEKIKIFGRTGMKNIRDTTVVLMQLGD